jgi:tryptophanyl-tRNA synthetase
MDTIDALAAFKIPENLDRQVYEVAATWLALGLDPEAGILLFGTRKRIGIRR